MVDFTFFEIILILIFCQWNFFFIIFLLTLLDHERYINWIYFITNLFLNIRLNFFIIDYHLNVLRLIWFIITTHIINIINIILIIVVFFIIVIITVFINGVLFFEFWLFRLIWKLLDQTNYLIIFMIIIIIICTLHVLVQYDLLLSNHSLCDGNAFL